MPQPTKQQVREYMERRRVERRAPPDMKQIRRELGWELTEIERRKCERRTMNSTDSLMLSMAGADEWS
jgi:hypothetical protein